MASNDDSRTTAIGLARYALEYLEAALTVDEHMGDRPEFMKVSPIPAYFLIAHALELTLKSYLRHQGLTVKQISSRALGHNLNALYSKSMVLGLGNHYTASQEDSDALNLLDALNQDHQLRYIKTGSKQFPLWSIVEPFAVKLHQAVGPLVGYKSLTIQYP
jgi:hypothetical protein